VIKAPNRSCGNESLELAGEDVSREFLERVRRPIEEKIFRGGVDLITLRKTLIKSELSHSDAMSALEKSKKFRRNHKHLHGICLRPFRAASV